MIKVTFTILLNNVTSAVFATVTTLEVTLIMQLIILFALLSNVNIASPCHTFGNTFYTETHLNSYISNKEEWHDVVCAILKGGFAFEEFKNYAMREILGPIFNTQQYALQTFGKISYLDPPDAPMCTIILLGFHNNRKFYRKLHGKLILMANQFYFLCR